MIVQVLGAGVLSVASQSSRDSAEHDTGGGVQGRRCQAHREVSPRQWVAVTLTSTAITCRVSLHWVYMRPGKSGIYWVVPEDRVFVLEFSLLFQNSKLWLRIDCR